MRHITADTAETERIGAIAAQALADIHGAIYGQPPQATRAWTDGDAILLVMRLPADVAAENAEPPLASMQRMVGAAVERRTGVALRPASNSADSQRGLVVLAFERVRVRSEEQDLGRAPAGPVRGSG